MEIKIWYHKEFFFFFNFCEALLYHFLLFEILKNTDWHLNVFFPYSVQKEIITEVRIRIKTHSYSQTNVHINTIYVLVFKKIHMLI